MAKNTMKQSVPKGSSSTEAVEAERSEVREMIGASDSNATELSLRMGRDKDYLRDFLSGRKMSMGARDRRLFDEIISKAKEADGSKHDAYLDPNQSDGGVATNLPVYAAVEGGAGGAMVVSTDAIDMVERPFFLKRVKGAYAILVVGESMIPAFAPGDMAMVNPKLPPLRGKDAIFIASLDGGDFRAIIKRFTKATDKEYFVEQFNPRKEMKLPKTEWQQAFRVVGKYNGG